MGDVRDSLSGLKSDFRHMLGRNKNKADKTRAGGGGERGGSPGLLPRPEPSVVTGSYREQEGSESNVDIESFEPCAAVDEGRSNWKSIAASASPLSSIFDGFMVRFPAMCCPQRSSVSLRTKANNQAIESLMPWTKALAEQLCEPVPDSDVKEKERRFRLEK